MCLAVPFRIVSIDGDDAVAESLGVVKKIKINFIREPKAGDYVMVHAGFAIERLKSEEAEADIEAFRELDAALADGLR